MDILSLRNALPERIETARLLLRQPDRRDVPALARLADNPRIAAVLARLPHPYGEADAIAFVDDFARRDTERVYAVTTRAGAFIGVAGLTLAKDTPPRLGYWLGEPHWGRGYGREAVGGLVAAATATGLCPVLEARVLAHNARSARLLEALGFAVLEETMGACGTGQAAPIRLYRRGTMVETAHAPAP